jgi:hypothetical protein
VYPLLRPLLSPLRAAQLTGCCALLYGCLPRLLPPLAGALWLALRLALGLAAPELATAGGALEHGTPPPQPQVLSYNLFDSTALAGVSAAPAGVPAAPFASSAFAFLPSPTAAGTGSEDVALHLFRLLPHLPLSLAACFFLVSGGGALVPPLLFHAAGVASSLLLLDPWLNPALLAPTAASPSLLLSRPDRLSLLLTRLLVLQAFTLPCGYALWTLGQRMERRRTAAAAPRGGVDAGAGKED